MRTRKRSRKERKSVSTASIQEDDSDNLKGKTTGLDQLIAWCQDFDMQCNFVLLIDYT
jgi:hypothetical protein